MNLRTIAIMPVVFLLAAGYCAGAGGAQCAENDFYAKFSGDWIAADYLYAADSGRLPHDFQRDAAFRIYDASGTGRMFQVFNFHESCEYEIVSAEKTKSGYEVLLSSNPHISARPGTGFKAIPLEKKAGRIAAFVRASEDPDFTPYRIFLRAGHSRGDNALRAVEDFISCRLFCGKYSAEGKPLEFLPEGKGRYDGRNFNYQVGTDYVLGPACDLVRFEADGPLSGLYAFEKIPGGGIIIKALEEIEKSGSGYACTDKKVMEFSPQPF